MICTVYGGISPLRSMVTLAKLLGVDEFLRAVELRARCSDEFQDRSGQRSVSFVSPS